jgi:hypothetical protein
MPPTWAVPEEWTGERCYILCGGESLRIQRPLVPLLRGRVIAVKEGVLLRPDADVLFLSGEHTGQIAKPLLPRFQGTHLIVRGKSCPELPADIKRVTRAKVHTRLCELRDHVCGYDTGTSAINLAFHFGAREIVLLGYDMTGHRWFTPQEHWHPRPRIPEANHAAHLAPLEALAKDCAARGLTIWNASPISRATMFPFKPLVSFLEEQEAA